MASMMSMTNAIAANIPVLFKSENTYPYTEAFADAACLVAGGDDCSTLLVERSATVACGEAPLALI